MADNHRIEDLRRRVQKDPSSIAFAQLAEECRRAGEFQEAVDVCRAGLELHPGYLSARVTLGRALNELEKFDEAQAELEMVVKGAPDNLAAVRALAEVLHRRGSVDEALAHYRTALALSRNDPELERIVAELGQGAGPGSAARPKPGKDHGLTFEQAERELSKHRAPVQAAAGSVASQAGGNADARTRTIAALEQWLRAIHVARAERRA
jgi:tetratricopeptide (TPR) repeat protein